MLGLKKTDDKPSANGVFSKIINWWKNLSRNARLAIILSIVLIIVGLLAFIFSRPNSNNAQTNEDNETTVTDIEEISSDATFSIVEGIVEYKVDANSDWTKADKDATFTTGASVRTTGASSRTEVTFEDGSVVRLDANSEVTFEKVTDEHITILQKNGYLYNRIVSSSDRIFAIRTEKAQFQSLGTAYRTTANGDEESTEVLQGSVNETISNTTIAQGKKYIAKSYVNPSQNNATSDINIEALKEDTFIMWNRERDLESELFKNNLGILTDIVNPTITISNPEVGSTIEINENETTAKFAISGNTERGSKLTVQSRSLAGSSPVEVTVDSTGNFTTPELEAPQGSSVFEFIAKDPTGNTTNLSVNYTIVKKTVANVGITLTKSADTDDSFTLSWSLSGLTTPDGVLVVFSETKGQTIMNGASSEVVKSSTTKKYNKSEFGSDKTMYFKVCRYNEASKTCDNYSNEISVKIP